MNLLVHLAHRAGEVVSVDELLEAVWKGVVVGSGSVYIVISQLRQALDDDHTKHIETIPKRGYRLTVPVTSLDTDGRPAEDHRLTSPQSPEGKSRIATRARAAAAAGLAIAAVTLGVAAALTGRGSGDTEPRTVRVGLDATTREGSAGTDSLASSLPVPVEVNRLLFRVYLSRSLDEGFALIDRATARYPDSELLQAHAHGAKAFLYAQSLTKTYHSSPVDAASRARTEQSVAEHAEAVLRAYPNGIAHIAHIALGTRDLYNWRWSAALESFRRANASTAERTPAFAHGIWLSSYLGQHDQAIAWAEELIAANAGDPARTLRVLAFAHAYAGNTGRALENLRVSLDGATGNYVTTELLVSLEIAAGENEAARSNLLTLAQPARGYFASLLDRDAASTAALELLRARSEAGESIGAGDWAMAHLAAGDTDGALSWLERAADKARNHEADESFYTLMALKMNVAKDPVLQRPELVDVLSRIRGD